MECITQCTRCDTKWEGDFEYCPKCEPVLARAERGGNAAAFEDWHGAERRAGDLRFSEEEDIYRES